MSSPVWRRRRRGVRARIARRHAARLEAPFAPYLTSADAFALIQAGLLKKIGTLVERYSHGWEHAYRQRWIVGMPTDVECPIGDQVWTLPREGASLEFVALDETTSYLEAVGQRWANEVGDWLWPAASEDEPSGQ